ncbi:transporter [Pseudomonas sp. Root329]|uniref:autotransporter outer membrane beta-barrel domain-containing protein n=1 Tax=Pseudomonas sp. Root329 TaxID=1736515 RepID=UPI0006FC8B3E|nr:autotransporter outer membrane beta-barrel domain-containing protein [Pseudomonas sp. Root329]KQV23140.1 transporter [Pseudomonas sp. Root329]
MSVQHKYRPKHLALAVALAVGCAEFTNAQELPEQAEPTGLAEATKQPDSMPDPLSRLQAFINADSTFKKEIDSPQPARRGISVRPEDRDDLIIVKNGGSFEGRVDGGKGTNVIQLIGTDGGQLGNTRNFNGLYVSQGSWTLTSTGDFHEGVLVLSDGILTNKGEIEGGAIVAGTLFNNGDIKGHVDVYEEGTFAGAGTVASLDVQGRLNVNSLHGAPKVKGDLKLSKTAVLAYEVNPDGRHETIKVDGTASLGGATLRIIAAPGDYPQTTQYTIIEADKVDGHFGDIENNLAFMTANPDYSDEKAVRLTYARNEVPFENLATNENGRELARSIEEPKASPTTQTPPNNTNAAVTALLSSTTETASQAIDQLDGGQNANLAKATLNSDSPISATMLSAMRQLDSASRYSNSSKRNAPRLAAGSEDNGRVWLQALGHGGTLDRDYDALKHSTQGLVLGADWGIDEEWRIGVMSGKSETRLDSRGLDGDLDSWHLGAYALRQNGPMSLRLGATYSNHDGSTKRRVAFKGFSDRPEGRYDANTQQAFAELGYNLGQANVSIEPFASLGYQRYQRDTYTEKGGAAALKVHGQTQNNLNSTFGLRLAKLNTLDNGMRLTPRLSAGWKHTYGDVYSDTRQRLVTGGKNFTVSGAPLDRDSLLVDAGLDLGLSAKHTLGVGLTGEIGTDSRNHGVTGQWRMSF